MYNYRRLILIAITVFAMLAPHLADARAGGGRSSSGSRGSRTYSMPSYSKAQPIQRSTTAAQKPSQQQGLAPAQQGFNPQNAGGMLGGGNPFWRGMAGGFLGAGIASMLFGHSSAMATGMGAGGGAGGMLGSLMQILLIGGLIYFAVRLFRGSSIASNASSMNNFSSNFSSSHNYQQAAADTTTPLLITSADKGYFEELLQKIQHNWSEGDLTRLRLFVTPEILQYFSEELSANSSRGLANKVDNIKLESADVVESWHEYELDYASARLQWSAVDYMVRLDKNPSDSGYIESGSNINPQMSEEIWTFVRSSGGNWLLSAIQQVN